MSQQSLFDKQSCPPSVLKPKPDAELERRGRKYPIPNYEAYAVDSHGRVFTKKIRKGNRWVTGSEWSEMATRTDRDGYSHVALCRHGKKRWFRVHRLVLIAIRGNPKRGEQGCHNDGDRTNNHISNLRWDTCKNNIADKRRHGTHREGVSHHTSKFTEQQVRDIRQMYASGKYTRSRLAAMNNVTYRTIQSMVDRKTYKDISD